jgi:alpha-galactosidase
MIALALANSAYALDNGLARTPPMGWNTWVKYELAIDEGLVRSMADAMVSTGMRDAGYHYVIVDAGWKGKGRDADGRLSVDRSKFPSGMKALAEYVHSKGLKFGLYTDAGEQDCVSGAPGSRDHEELDAATFAAWGVDFVKEDWCKAEGLDAKEAYGRMSAALRKTGRPMLFSMCEWGDNKPWEWAAGIANMWRTTGDNQDCWDCGRETQRKPGGYPRGWTLILDAQPGLERYAGAGHWNDPDMLEVGSPGLSVEESRAHFSLWAILAAPLIAGCDLRAMPQEIAEILLNKEVIAVDQDAAGKQGTRVKRDGEHEVWARPLEGGASAVVLFNRGTADAWVRAEWSEIGFGSKDTLWVRDLWKHADTGARKGGYAARVPAHGVVMLRVSNAR